jgi:hypothetical protein
MYKATPFSHSQKQEQDYRRMSKTSREVTAM